MLRKTPKARLARLAAPLARDWRAVLQEFLLHKQAEGRAPRTIRDYRIRLSRFFEAHPEAFGDFEAFRRAVREHLAAFDGKAPATFNLPLEYLRAFCRWCVAEGYLPGDPTAGLSKRKDPGQARAVPEEVLAALLEACDRRTFTGLRDYALILFQLDTSVRPGEALRLVPADFNLQALEAFIPNPVAKTREGRTVVYSPVTAKAIRKLLAARPPEWDASVPVFCSQDGRPMLVNSWTHRLEAYGRKIGHRVTPYMLRHSSAIMYLRGGGDVFTLQRQLGHASLVMTRRYVHLASQDVHQAHAKASPVMRLVPQRQRARRRLEP
jgi:integrase